MEKYIILGHSNSVLAIELDLIYQKKEINKIDIVSNTTESQDTNNYLLEELDIKEYFHDNYTYNNSNNYILGVNSPVSKNKVFSFFKKNYNIDIDNYTNIYANNINLPTKYTIGTGCLINCGATIGPFTKLGNFVTINRNSSIGHHNELSDFVTISPGVNIAGTCKIGKNSLICTGATIINNINIGENVIVGAGSVVTKDIPDNVIYYGVPAKFIRQNKPI
jgi:sugar O-acyltransferase (sialic acid O-acetyltransferase NeuD family)